MTDTVLITGAGGMLGRQLLSRLCAGRQVEKVMVLAHNRQPEFAHSKIEILSGNVTREDFGLSLAARRAVGANVSVIIHGAALTSFSSELEAARAVNVIGVENLLGLAGHCRRLRGICHLSTVYIAGRRTGTIREDELTHGCGFVNAYEQSKYEAEQLLQSQAHELPISIVRLSTILGDSCDGAVDKLGAIHQALRFFFLSLAPFVPGTGESPVDLISADYAAACVAACALQDFPPRTWHVCGGADCLTLQEMLDVTLQLFCTYRPAWRKRVIEKPAIVDLKTFQLFVKSVESLADCMLKDSVAVIKQFAPQLAYPKQFDDATTVALLQDAGVVRPYIQNYYSKVIRYLLENNWQTARCAQTVA